MKVFGDIFDMIGVDDYFDGEVGQRMIVTQFFG